ncbi:LuxR family transcriptional regulator [Paenibacillus pinisoli]|uniref:LuxR family transcriptional regulator n=2 Tax=Paenibacillus pinisoli TaxID=1276110 RepID=A0A3A6PEH9_9BACL|nr:LuxR C-terminal-related transcriptional regulator [Paenibacillus pinisoli]RJX38530.1 LuxR family transcriptional regulator [Paenibacillus pinisoli]
MKMPILTTKLYIPPPRSGYVLRSRLTGMLHEGLNRKLSLILAPAGYGKTTLASEWLAGSPAPSAWLSLDEGDNDVARFLSYLIAALRKLAPELGESVLGVLQTPQTPPVEWIMAHILNELDGMLTERCVIVLDDYHVIDSPDVIGAVGLLLERLPSQLHLVMTTRTEPKLPLSRLRARDQLTEVRTADLRFRSDEAAEFINRAMELQLDGKELELLGARTEGWIAGLQLAALLIKGQPNALQALDAFGGNHPYVLDYLAEEALNGQDPGVRSFLLRTAILDRMSGSLCDSLLDWERESSLSGSGQAMLEQLERINLFIVPLDAERRWFRYHHLFGEVLRQRLLAEEGKHAAAELHIRASRWYEENGCELEAFQHAAKAGDVDRTACLAEAGGMPLLFRGAVAPVLAWLGSLPDRELHARPSLEVMYASALLMKGDLMKAVLHLESAEKALQAMPQDVRTSDIIGHAASIRATLAVSRHDAETILSQARRTLAHLHPRNQAVRTATVWTLGYAYQLQGDRAAAEEAYSEALAVSQTIGHGMIALMSMLGLGLVRQSDNQLRAAGDWYRRVLELAGDPPLPVACEAHLGLGAIYYERNDMAAAEQHAAEAARLAPLLQHTDRIVACKLLQAKVKLANNEAKEAAALWTEAEGLAKNYRFTHQKKGLAAMRTALLLSKQQHDQAAGLLKHDEPTISLAKVFLANSDASAALSMLVDLRHDAEENGRSDELLQLKAIQAIALHMQGNKDEAVSLLLEVLTEAEGEGFVRLFLDEGPPMEELLLETAKRRQLPDYIGTLLAYFRQSAECAHNSQVRRAAGKQLLIEPLSSRELEVLRLIAEGLSNTEIASRLFLALSTVKGHNRIIFDKLQVSRRTEAVARARELGLL